MVTGLGNPMKGLALLIENQPIVLLCRITSFVFMANKSEECKFIKTSSPAFEFISSLSLSLLK